MRKFTSAHERIVRIYHPVIYQELVDIAGDLDVPLQTVFDKFCERVFERCAIDTVLIEVVADLDEVGKAYLNDDIPF